MNAAPTPHWSLDPVELDRTLDGELQAEDAARRQAEVDADEALRARVEPRRRFLASLRDAGAAYRAHAADATPAHLEGRVRLALRADRARIASRGRWMRAAAAMLVVGLGTLLLWPRGPGAEAMPLEVLTAAEAARSDQGEPAGCLDQSALSPRNFPPVKEGALQVVRCVREDERMVAQLRRPEDLPSVGYVAVAERGAGEGPDIGMTDLGDMVVFDIAYASRHHYLAVSKQFLERLRERAPGRESCAACHNRSRDGQKNPHNIVKRSWRLR
jgi:hypothetical protein